MLEKLKERIGKIKFIEREKEKQERKDEVCKKIDDLLNSWDTYDESLIETKEAIDATISDLVDQIEDADNQLINLEEDEIDRCKEIISERKKLQDEIIALNKKKMEAEELYAKKIANISAELRGLIESRILLDKPKELPKWAERIPGELAKGTVMGGLLFLGWVIKDKMLDDGSADKNSEFFINNMTKL